MATLLRLAGDSKSKPSSKEEAICSAFNAYRGEQRQLASKLTTYEIELSEVKTVINALLDVDKTRKCFRMIKTVMYESTVENVLPSLIERKEELEKLMEDLKRELESKSIEIEKFKENNNIKFLGIRPASSQSTQPVVEKLDEILKTENSKDGKENNEMQKDGKSTIGKDEQQNENVDKSV